MRFVGLVLTLFACSLSTAQESERPKTFGDHYGYLMDVKEERNKRDIEMVLLDPPKPGPKPLQEIIFNQKLSKEFQQQYEYRFGQSQAEQTLNTVGRSDDYNYYTGRNVTVQQYQTYQQQFAEYMGRRLVEYHVDNWVKNDPDLRPVYEFKDRVSNVSVAVRKGYKVKWKYNFAGPNMEVKVENPYEVDVKMRMEMSGVVSSPSEVIYTLGYQCTPRVYLTGLYRQEDGL